VPDDLEVLEREVQGMCEKHLLDQPDNHPPTGEFRASALTLWRICNAIEARRAVADYDRFRSQSSEEQWQLLKKLNAFTDRQEIVAFLKRVEEDRRSPRYVREFARAILSTTSRRSRRTREAAQSKNQERYTQRMEMARTGRADARPKPNDISLALLVGYGESRILLGGDVESRNWEQVVREERATRGLGLLFATAQAIKVCHHGSANGHHAGIWAKCMCQGRHKPVAVITPSLAHGLPSTGGARADPHLYAEDLRHQHRRSPGTHAAQIRVLRRHARSEPAHAAQGFARRLGRAGAGQPGVRPLLRAG
jgi:hypothetical protein